MATDREAGSVEPTARSQDGQRRVERRVGLPSGRAVVGGLLMALAAIGTFLAYQGATGDDRIDILVAANDLRVGDVIGADDVRFVSADLPTGVRGLFASADAAVGRHVIAPVNAGEFLLESATSEARDDDAVLEVTIEISGSRLSSALRPGERVDVFSTHREFTELIAVDTRVLSISGGDDGSLFGARDNVVVRLAVADFAQVEAIVHANAVGDITLIRAAIGAQTGEVGRRYQPGETRSEAAEEDGE